MSSLSQSILVDNLCFEGHKSSFNELTVSEEIAIQYLVSLVNAGREALLQIEGRPHPVVFVDVVKQSVSHSRRLVTFRFEYKY